MRTRPPSPRCFSTNLHRRVASHQVLLCKFPNYYKIPLENLVKLVNSLTRVLELAEPVISGDSTQRRLIQERQSANTEISTDTS